LYFTGISYFVAAVVAYYAVLYLLSLRPQRSPDPAETETLFVLLIPARNEQDVIAETLSSVLHMEYDKSLVVLVNDGSCDATGPLARSFAATEPRLMVVDRDASVAGQGKSSVLNHAFLVVREMVEQGDPRIGGRTSDQVIVGILDADGRLDRPTLPAVAPFFDDPRVGTVQIAVRIGNAGEGLLERLQDIEFVGFSWLAQIARDRLGSSGLGGNGQFSRLSALESLGDEPWTPHHMTEDLDLGLRLVEAGWTTRFCTRASVTQQALNRWRPLLRQRTRWIQGHYACWSHIPSLWRADGPLTAKADLTIYLLLVVSVMAISLGHLFAVLDAVGVLHIQRSFVTLFPGASSQRLVIFGFSVLPLLVFMVTYQLHSRHPAKWWELPAYSLFFTLYSYVWLIATVRAWWRLARGKQNWVKTPRLTSSSEHRLPAISHALRRQ
jgi:1,2-diacylglycerol 3-beta-glucosyltransferase